MRIAALSDFHIGATAQNDGFRHSDQRFHRFLDELERDHDEIVLLGDIFQAEHGWSQSWTAMTAEIEHAKARVESLWRRLSGSSYVYVYGNHDIVASAVLSAREEHRIESDGFVAYFIHGHQFDPLLRKLRPLARAGTWFSGRLRAAGLRRAADWLEHQDVEIKHRRFQGRDGPYAAAASELFRSQHADVVVMGHTHIATRVATDAGIYANTGTCSMGQLSYVSIDTEERSVDVLAPTSHG